MENVNPFIRDILKAHLMPKAELTEQDKRNALRLAMDPHTEMSTDLRLRTIVKYGTAADIARFVESMPN